MYYNKQSAMRTLRMVLQYDGTSYHGWQIQPNGVTIQEVLQQKIAVITGEEATVQGAGRTDAGVHALGQVACFTTRSRLDVPVMKRALNSVLPRDIRITDVSVAPEGFHPRFSAKAKRYFYVIVNSPVVSPFMQRYAWMVSCGLSLEGMKEAADTLKGSHDFSSFRASGCDARTSRRTMFSLDVREGGVGFPDGMVQDRVIRIVMEADGFLRHMARNIAGTLVEVGRGRIKSGSLEGIILSRDRARAGPTAPACGLFLERVIY